VPAAGPAATILVLEASGAVSELVEQALCGNGHRILSTQSALEALAVARRIQIDLLLAGDLFQQPRDAVVGELRSIQPSLAVVSICDAAPLSLDDLRAVVAETIERGDS
jgi:DNA-binding response OmpR family regulator